MQSSVLFGVSWLKSSIFKAESFMIPLAELVATGKVPRFPLSKLKLFFRLRDSLNSLLREDAERIAAGFYPASVLWMGESSRDPLSHVLRIPKIFREAVASSSRRKEKKTKTFSREAAARKKNLPEYYQRNFHFQKDGYLSQESAELYDHQVELLFVGAGDVMRRLPLAPLKRHFGGGTGKGKKILEIGCGTGSATMYLRAAFPDAQITAVDLSAPYLELAQKRLPKGGVNFLEAAGEKLPFAKGAFDAVVSVFLFHELPLKIRQEVLRESKRVLKAKGIFAYVDSLQLGDNPELDEPLKGFPVAFHEPFYTNYVKTPMEGLLAEAGFTVRERELGFFSKMVAAVPNITKTARKKA